MPDPAPVATTTAVDVAGDTTALVTAIKTGWKTSEMWITVGVVVLCAVLAVYSTNPIVQAISLGVSATESGIYKWSRTQVKS